MLVSECTNLSDGSLLIPHSAASRYKCFKLIGLHPLCAVVFTAGYALREFGAFNYIYSPTNLIVYILSQVCIYVCPYVTADSTTGSEGSG